MLAGTVVVVVAALVLALVVGGRADSASRARGPAVAPGPVVLVPGYGGGTDSLDVLAAKIGRASCRERV